MDQESYERWWLLHLRVVKGETLNPEEQSEYDAGIATLDQEEKIQLQPSGRAQLQQSRRQVKRLQAVHAQLTAKSTQLDEQIDCLETAYRSLTGYELASGMYVPSQA